MNERTTRVLAAAVSLLLAVPAGTAVAAPPAPALSQTVDGLVFHYGVVPAAYRRR